MIALLALNLLLAAYVHPLAYSNNERAKQLLYVLDDSIWGMKITALE
jgi:hypothetical protein